METATFAGGCFWCTEAVFQMIRGVKGVIPGYAGGNMESPSYEEVSSGATGHAEAIQIEFNPEEITYKELLYIFFKTHDPTTPNQQGSDVGSQYRSAIFYNSEEQKNLAQKAKEAAQKEYSSPIVTQILPLGKFYKAEGYHQDYYKKNSEAVYCKLVIDPKIQKLKKDFGKYLK